MIIKNINDIKCYFCDHPMRKTVHGHDAFVCQQQTCKVQSFHFILKKRSSTEIGNFNVKLDVKSPKFCYGDSPYYDSWTLMKSKVVYYDKHKVLEVPEAMELNAVLDYCMEYVKNVNVKGFCRQHEKNLEIMS